MRHVQALVYKYLFITAIVAVTTGWWGGGSLVRAMWLGLTLTAALYILGDLVILRYFCNWVATIADAGVAFLVLRSGTMLPGAAVTPATSAASMSVSLLAAVAIGVAEYFFHQYLLSRQVVTTAAGMGDTRGGHGGGQRSRSDRGNRGDQGNRSDRRNNDGSSQSDQGDRGPESR